MDVAAIATQPPKISSSFYYPRSIAKKSPKSNQLSPLLWIESLVRCVCHSEKPDLGFACPAQEAPGSCGFRSPLSLGEQ